MKTLAASIGCIGTLNSFPEKTRTGINKHPRAGIVAIGALGLQGDAICNRKYHGGLDQAVYIEGSLSLERWASELDVEIRPDQFGENLVIGGLDDTVVAAGDLFLIGDVVLEATAPRIPCVTAAQKMGRPQFVKLYRKAARPGFYCRVRSPGSSGRNACAVSSISGATRRGGRNDEGFWDFGFGFDALS